MAKTHFVAVVITTLYVSVCGKVWNDARWRLVRVISNQRNWVQLFLVLLLVDFLQGSSKQNLSRSLSTSQRRTVKVAVKNHVLWVSQTFCYLPAVIMGKLLKVFDLSFYLLQNSKIVVENSTCPIGLSWALNDIMHIKCLTHFHPVLSVQLGGVSELSMVGRLVPEPG